MRLKPIECLSKFTVTLLQLINHVENDFDVSKIDISVLKTSLALDSQKNSKTKKHYSKKIRVKARGACRIIGGNSTSRFCTIESHGNDSTQRNWMPYELKLRDVERRFFTCEQLIQRQQRKGFLHRIVTGDKKWIFYDN